MSWGAIGGAAVGVVGGALLNRGGGGGGGTQTTTSTATPWGPQQDYLKDVYEQAQAMQAPDVSGSAALQQAAAQGYGQYAAGLPAQIAPAQAAQQQILQTAMSPQANPAFQQYLNLANQQLAQQYQQQTAPALTSNAVAMGNVGSSRAGIAEGLARQGLTQQQALMTADLTNRAYGSGLQATLQALGMSPQIAALGAMSPEALVQQAALTRGAETAQSEQERQRLLDYQALVSGNVGQTTTSTAPAPYVDRGTQALGYASMGAGIGSAIQQSRQPSPAQQPAITPQPTPQPTWQQYAPPTSVWS